MDDLTRLRLVGLQIGGLWTWGADNCSPAGNCYLVFCFGVVDCQTIIDSWISFFVFEVRASGWLIHRLAPRPTWGGGYGWARLWLLEWSFGQAFAPASKSIIAQF
jgi:hypothetical protein